MNDPRAELADSYVGLRASAAFKDLYGFLLREVETAKGLAVLAPAEMSTAEVRRRIIHWQEREKIVLTIQSVLDEQEEIKKSIEEDAQNERSIVADRNSRRGW